MMPHLLAPSVEEDARGADWTGGPANPPQVKQPAVSGPCPDARQTRRAIMK